MRNPAHADGGFKRNRARWVRWVECVHWVQILSYTRSPGKFV